MATEQLAVKLLMDSKQYVKSSQQAATATSQISKTATTATGTTTTLTKSMGNLGSLVKGAAVTGAFFALADGIGSAVTAAEDAAAIMKVTEQVIKQTGGAANVSAQDVSDMAAQLASLTGVEDDVIQQGANVILTFKNIANQVGEGNDVFTRANELMLDISATMGTDTSSAALMLGKALNDPLAGMTALQRAGLTLTKQQKDQVKAYVASNDLLSAQKLILDELESQVGGTAAASAKATDRMGAAWGEIMEMFGEGLLPLVEDFADGLAIAAGMSPAVNDLGDAFREIQEVNLSDTFVIGEVVGLTDFRETLENIIATADLTDAELIQLKDQLLAIGGEAGWSAGRAEVLTDVIEDRLVPGLEASIGAANRHRGASKDLADVQEDVEDAFEGTELAVQDAKVAIEAYDTAFRRLTDPVFRHIDDQNNLADAIENYNTVTNDAKSTTEDIERAYWDMVEAQLEVNSSGAELPDTFARTEDALLLLNEQLDAGGTGAAFIRDELEKMDGETYRANFEAFFSITGNQNAFDAIMTGDAFLGESNVFRAAGGPVQAGSPYIVGEKGPEWFVPNQSGTVLPNGSGMMGGGVTVAVYGNVYADDLEDHVVTAVEKARRRGVNV